jgi:CheY-like chemotaxis protein
MTRVDRCVPRRCGFPAAASSLARSAQMKTAATNSTTCVRVVTPLQRHTQVTCPYGTDSAACTPPLPSTARGPSRDLMVLDIMLPGVNGYETRNL